MGNAIPKRGLSAAALILNSQHEVLIVKPVYRDFWESPGGLVEADESPVSACRREIEEELALRLPVTQLLCVEYQSKNEFGTESLQFVFFGGILSPDQRSQLSLPSNELAEHTFLPLPEAVQKLHPRVGRRIAAAFQAVGTQRIAHLENGTETA